MRLIGLAVVLAVGLTLAPLAVGAHETAKVPRIGYLVVNLAVSPHQHEAFRQGLRELDYVEGRNIEGARLIGNRRRTTRLARSVGYGNNWHDKATH